MCLYNQEKFRIRKKVGYKAFWKVDGLLYHRFIQTHGDNKPVKQNVWLESRSKESGTIKDTKRKIYKPGFHIYLNKRDAMAVLKETVNLGYIHMGEEILIAEVEFDEVLTMGIENHKELEHKSNYWVPMERQLKVVVAHKMKVGKVIILCDRTRKLIKET